MSPVVVAHGLWMPGWETATLRRRLAAAGFDTHLFKFRTVGASLNDNADRLAEFVAKVPGGTLDVIGHSLGGVVALTMLNRHALEREGRVVCLGSPLNDSRTARALVNLPGGEHILGKSMSDFLDRGGVEPWDGRRELGIVAGNLPVGFGRLLGALKGPSDGTVAVDETQLEGAADHIVLPVSHFSMLFSRRVADQTISFLREGRFAR